MTEIIVEFLNFISGAGVLRAASGDLLKGVAEYNPAAYEATVAIAQTVVKPVASVILSLMLVVELARNASRFDGDGQLGVKIIASTLFKFVLLIIAVQYAPQILAAMHEVNEAIIRGTSQMGSVDGSGDLSENLGDRMRGDIERAGVLQQVGVLIVIIIPFLVSVVAVIVVKIMIALRFLEVYLLTSFAALPVAFIAHPDTKPIAIGYLRAYGAAVIHGATLYIGMFLCGHIIASALAEDRVGDIGGQSIMAWSVVSFLPLCLGSVLIIVMALASGRLAKALVGNA